VLASRGLRESETGIKKMDPDKLPMLRRQASKVMRNGLLAGFLLTVAVLAIAWTLSG
jgi:hypothetical protein